MNELLMNMCCEYLCSEQQNMNDASVASHTCTAKCIGATACWLIAKGQQLTAH